MSSFYNLPRNVTFQESIFGQPYQDQKEILPCIGQDLQRLCAQVGVSGKSERKTVQRYLLSRRIRTQHRKGAESTGPLYEGQTAKYGRTCFRDPHTVHGAAKDKHDRFKTS